MSKKRKRNRNRKVETQAVEKKPGRAEGDTERVRRVKAMRDAPAKPRSVDSDILFSLPVIKVMIAVFAAGLVFYVLSYFSEVLGISEAHDVLLAIGFALFAITFVLLVIGRVQGKKLTSERRAAEGKLQK